MNSGRIPLTLTRLVMLACAGAGAAAEVDGQAVPLSELSTEELGRPISVFFDEAPIHEVLFTFAEFADRSIVPGAGLDRLVSAEIREQPWNVALDALLGAHGLVAHQQESGIILVHDMRRAFEREAVLPIVTEALTVRYGDALELQDLIAAILSDRGRVSVSTASNALVISDIPRVVESARRLVSDLDVRVRQVDIAAKIIFVNRSGLAGFGITYDLKDTRGNQLNLLVPGIVDADGDGVISAGERQTEAGIDVVSLGGNSLAALGNATNRVANPTLSLLTSLVIGRTTLVGFIDALEAAQLTDVEAQPSVRVMDNRTARIVVGEETPVRVIDAGAQIQANGAVGTRSTVPVATVDYKETGVILEVTPPDHRRRGDHARPRGRTFLCRPRPVRCGPDLPPAEGRVAGTGEGRRDRGHRRPDRRRDGGSALGHPPVDGPAAGGAALPHAARVHDPARPPDPRHAHDCTCGFPVTQPCAIYGHPASVRCRDLRTPSVHLPHASGSHFLPYRRRVPWSRPRRRSGGVPGRCPPRFRPGHRPGVDPPAGGLRPGTPHADRVRPGGDHVRPAPGLHAGLTALDGDLEPRLGELDHRDGARGTGSGRQSQGPAPRLPAAAGSRRSGRCSEVRQAGRERCA